MRSFRDRNPELHTTLFNSRVGHGRYPAHPPKRGRGATGTTADVKRVKAILQRYKQGAAEYRSSYDLLREEIKA